MDVNYSRWMSKDPDAEPEAIEDEPRRFRIPQPSPPAVAIAAMAGLVILGGGALVRSLATPDVSADQVQAVQTPAAEESGPGAAAVDESTYDESTYDDSTSVGSAEETATRDRFRRPASLRLMERREFRETYGLSPGRPWRDRPPRDDSTEPALPPPMFRP
jgi:hypothetical protein